MGEKWPVNFACGSDFHVNPGFTWKTALLPPQGRHAVDFFRPKNPTASAGIEPAILGTRGQHANHLRNQLNVHKKCVTGWGYPSIRFSNHRHTDFCHVLSPKNIPVIPQNYVVVSSLMLARLSPTKPVNNSTKASERGHAMWGFVFLPQTCQWKLPSHAGMHWVCIIVVMYCT